MTPAPRRPGSQQPRASRLHDAHLSPRALTLAASIAWRHAAADPVRALVLAQRVLPGALSASLRLAGPYGRAALLWGAGDRPAALAALDASPQRLAAFSLAVDQPATAAAALSRVPDDDPARPVLAARLAWREGRLNDAIDALDPARSRKAGGRKAGGRKAGGRKAGGRKARRLRALLTAEQSLLHEGDSMIMGHSRQIAPVSAHDHETSRTSGRVLHLVNDALPSISAGYTIRTHEIV